MRDPAGPCPAKRERKGVREVCTMERRGHDGPCDWWAARRPAPR